MTKFNRDMRVDEEFVEAHPDIRPLLANDKVERSFWRYDGAAIFWKKIYEIVGTASLISVTFATLYLGYRVTLAPTYGVLQELDAAGMVIGGIGLVAQFALVFGKLRDRWLLARFAAERMRCLKYQSFHLLFDPKNGADLEAAVKAYAETSIVSIRQKLRGGRGAITAFKPADALPVWSSTRQGDVGVLEQAIRAYDDLRIGVQTEHFEDRVEHARKMERSPSAISDWFLVAASALTMVELALNGAHSIIPDLDVLNIPPVVQPWWWFSVWTLFVVSAVLAIYGQARVQRVDADRYEQYGREMTDVRKQPVTDWPSFATRVYAMELVALRELQDFCRDQKYFGYIF